MAPNEQAAALYRTWFGMLEQWARMFSPWLQPAGNPFAAAPPGEDATAQAVPEPVKPIAEALNLTRQLLSQSYAALGAAPPGQDWQGLAAANAARLKAFFETGAAAQKQWLEGSARAMTGNGAGVERWWPAVRVPRVPGRCSTSGRLTRCWTDSTVRSARSRTRSAWDPRGHCATPGASSSPRTCSGARRSSTISPSLPERGATSSTASASGSARWVRAASASSRS